MDEKKYVVDVYNKIAYEFNHTRGYMWPGVKRFLAKQTKDDHVEKLDKGLKIFVGEPNLSELLDQDKPEEELGGRQVVLKSVPLLNVMQLDELLVTERVGHDVINLRWHTHLPQELEASV